jgi:hypothetical protein
MLVRHSAEQGYSLSLLGAVLQSKCLENGLTPPLVLGDNPGSIKKIGQGDL